MATWGHPHLHPPGYKYKYPGVQPPPSRNPAARKQWGVVHAHPGCADTHTFIAPTGRVRVACTPGCELARETFSQYDTSNEDTGTGQAPVRGAAKESWLMTGEMRGASRQSSRAVRGQTSQFHTQTLSGWGADVSVDAWRRAPAAHSITLHQRQRLCVRHGAAERAAPRARRDLACFFLLPSCSRYFSPYRLSISVYVC